MSSIDPELSPLFVDEHLVVMDKPAGVPAQPDHTGDPSLLQLVAALLVDNDIGLVHRLDRPVSGVMVFARGAEALRRLHTLFREHRVEKVYWAIVEGHPMVNDDGTTTMENLLAHDPHRRKARVVGSNGRQARLHLRTLASGDRYTLVEVRPQEGLFHQIRTQLAAFGHPIKGDVKYGARRGEKDRRIALHARFLAFEHPFTGVPLRVTAPPPNDGVWSALVAMAAR